MIKQDWLMNQIEIVARTLAKLLFNKDTTDYIIIDYQVPTDTDVIYNKLRELIDEGKINEAENLLFDKIDEEIEENGEAGESRQYLEVAIDFYSRLNDLSDKTLEEVDFERQEIDEGIREVADLYNISII
ncbi:MAG: DUF6483 family protein [Oscillospiraceae bacterium]|nr:DUF6483 family protein [Oscillospiraceae bacterium]